MGRSLIRRYGSAGLGLAISKGLIEWGEREAGRKRFFVLLPIRSNGPRLEGNRAGSFDGYLSGFRVQVTICVERRKIAIGTGLL